MFLVRGGGIPPGELFGFSSADARTEGTRTHAGSLLLGAGAAVGGLQQHPPLGWLFRSREAWFAARKGLPGCPQPRCKAGAFLPPADVTRTPFRMSFMELPAGRHVVFCHLASKLFPFLLFPKLIERRFPSYLVFSSWIYLFILLPSWDFIFKFLFFSHLSKNCFSSKLELSGLRNLLCSGNPVVPPPSPWHPLLLAPTAAFCAGTVTGLSVIVFCMPSMKPGVLSPQYRKEIKMKAQIYGRQRMNTFIT